MNRVFRVFRKVAGRASVLREGVKLHTLRHTCAELLPREGCDLVAIQLLLGHSDLLAAAVCLHGDAGHLQAAVAIRLQA